MAGDGRRAATRRIRRWRSLISAALVCAPSPCARVGPSRGDPPSCHLRSPPAGSEAAFASRRRCGGVALEAAARDIRPPQGSR
eukprot:5544531-Pyramimonas_sp.AAC.1